MIYKRESKQKPQQKSLVCYVAQENLKEERNEKEEEGIATKKDTQIAAKEKLEEVNLGIDPQRPRPISISSKLAKEEKSELISFLKEFKDVFA